MPNTTLPKNLHNVRKADTTEIVTEKTLNKYHLLNCYSPRWRFCFISLEFPLIPPGQRALFWTLPEVPLSLIPFILSFVKPLWPTAIPKRSLSTFLRSIGETVLETNSNYKTKFSHLYSHCCHSSFMSVFLVHGTGLGKGLLNVC